jgi:hypothetical protein
MNDVVKKKDEKNSKNGVFLINMGLPPTTHPAQPPSNLQQNFYQRNW